MLKTYVVRQWFFKKLDGHQCKIFMGNDLGDDICLEC